MQNVKGGGHTPKRCQDTDADQQGKGTIISQNTRQQAHELAHRRRSITALNPRGLLEYQQRDEAQTEHYGTYAKEHGIVHRIAPRTYVAQNVAHEHPSADAADPANDLASPQHSPAPPSWQCFG